MGKGNDIENRITATTVELKSVKTNETTFPL
jgi:hypothetical protein